MIGIYKITNIENGDFYIGSSKNIEKRWKQHIALYNKKGRHFEYYIYKAMRKYGIEKFEFKILEICEQKELINLEQKYYEELNPRYNIIQPKENPIQNDLVRLRQKERCKEAWQNRSDISKKKSLDNLDKGKENVEFLKFKKKSKSVKCINIKTGEELIFKSMWEAEKQIGVNRSSISQILNKNHARKQSKGYTFEFVNKS